MMRRILERFTDWRGPMVRLKCGHIVQAHRRDIQRYKRGCSECTKRRDGKPYKPAYVPALHDIRCGCGPCNGRLDPR